MVMQRTLGSVKHGDVQSEYLLRNAGGPTSGTSGTFAGEARPGALLWDSTNYVLYINEGATQASPYWTPVSHDQPGLLSYYTEFADGVGKAIADTGGSATLNTGVRVIGQGVAETDSGAVAQAAAEGVRGDMRLTTTNEVAHTIALATPVVFQPDQHAPIVIDCEFTHVSAITLRATFCGFAGTIADALDPRATGATTTITLVDDDLVALFQDVGLTDTDGIFLPHNKGNAAASIATTATGVDLSQTIAAAATFQRWRVEIDASGNVVAFIDKVQVGSITAALDADEEVGAVFYVESTSTATKSADVRRFGAWASK